MKHTMKILGLTVAGVAIAMPAMAADMQSGKKKTRTVTEVVGYVETIEYPAQTTETFTMLDKNHDGGISFNEYRNGSMVDEPYGVFLRMDANGDERVSIDELNSFSKTKGGAKSASRFNFNQPKQTDID